MTDKKKEKKEEEVEKNILLLISFSDKLGVELSFFQLQFEFGLVLFFLIII